MMKDMKKTLAQTYEVIVNEDGSRAWWVDNKRHRVDGPALEGADGSREWLVENKLHRTDGPAIERADGRREWWVEGELHRLDGPAVERADGGREWWVEGERVAEATPLCDGLVDCGGGSVGLVLDAGDGPSVPTRAPLLRVLVGTRLEWRVVE